MYEDEKAYSKFMTIYDSELDHKEASLEKECLKKIRMYVHKGLRRNAIWAPWLIPKSMMMGFFASFCFIIVDEKLSRRHQVLVTQFSAS